MFSDNNINNNIVGSATEGELTTKDVVEDISNLIATGNDEDVTERRMKTAMKTVVLKILIRMIVVDKDKDEWNEFVTKKWRRKNTIAQKTERWRRTRRRSMTKKDL